MEKDWGKAPGRVMTTESGDILVPGLMDGHIFLTVQAPRGYGFDAAKIYHDPFIAPTHQYLAYYQWIRDVWGADAVVHVGTHGNLEWLPGKSAGMDRGSYPDLALGSLPNIYPYHMTITGEGIQAKRRGGACLVDHLPAPMEEAGTYEELAELEQAMDEYAHFEKSEPETAKRLVPRIRELAEKASLDDEVPYTEADLAGYLSRLHCYIEDLKNSECHVGLHILGEMPKGETLIHEILALLRLPNGDIPSICELLAEEEGTSVDTLLGQAQTLFPNGLTGGEWMARLQKKAEGLVRKLAELHFDKEKAKALGTEREQPLLRFVCEEVYPRHCRDKKGNGAYPSRAFCPLHCAGDLRLSARGRCLSSACRGEFLRHRSAASADKDGMGGRKRARRSGHLAIYRERRPVSGKRRHGFLVGCEYAKSRAVHRGISLSHGHPSDLGAGQPLCEAYGAHSPVGAAASAHRCDGAHQRPFP